MRAEESPAADNHTARPPLRAWTWVAVAALVVVNVSLHKPISDVCDALFARVGRTSYEYVTLAAITALSLAGVVLLWRRLTWRARPRRRLLAIALLLVGMFGAQQLLLVSNVE